MEYTNDEVWENLPNRLPLTDLEPLFAALNIADKEEENELKDLLMKWINSVFDKKGYRSYYKIWDAIAEEYREGEYPNGREAFSAHRNVRNYRIDLLIVSQTNGYERFVFTGETYYKRN